MDDILREKQIVEMSSESFRYRQVNRDVRNSGMRDRYIVECKEIIQIVRVEMHWRIDFLDNKLSQILRLPHRRHRGIQT